MKNGFGELVLHRIKPFWDEKMSANLDETAPCRLSHLLVPGAQGAMQVLGN